MAGRSNDEHARALEAFSGGAADSGASEAAPPSARPAPSPKPKARAASPLDVGEVKPAETIPSATAPASAQPAPTPLPIPKPEPAAAVGTETKANPDVKPPLRTATPSAKQIELKRTLIPLLLTMGTVLPLGGVISILLGEDSLIGEAWTLPVSMIALGLLILGAAILTMLQVKTMVARNAR